VTSVDTQQDVGTPAGLPAIGQELIQRIESHCVLAWPAQVVERTTDGWVLRATPGLLGRGRSNHALAPPWSLSAAEIQFALRRAEAFASRHGIECGIQVGPLEVHIPLLDEVAVRGWEIQQSVLVMTGATEAIVAGEPAAERGDPDFRLDITDHATPGWVSAWEVCEPGRDNTREHVKTVFKLLAENTDGRTVVRFARSGDHAVGIAVEYDGIVGLFCLAVDPGRRRQGIGRKLVRGLLAGSSAPLTYLQVFSGNHAGIGLYNSLGFAEAYRYCHCVAPSPSPSPSV
jgi:ribosomal protein S18 acetylase RimI-like enzyme